MVPLRYLTPFAFLVLLPVGGWLGGAWSFMAAGATPLCLVGLDEGLGEEAGSAALPQPEVSAAQVVSKRRAVLPMPEIGENDAAPRNVNPMSSSPTMGSSQPTSPSRPARITARCRA